MDDKEFDSLVNAYAGKVQPNEISIKLNEELQERAKELAEKMLAAIKLQEQLIALNKRIGELRYTVLPDMMNRMGMSSMTTDGGVKLSISPFFSASLSQKVPEEKREKAYAYLRQVAPDILKTQVVTTYDTGELTLATRVMKILKQCGENPQLLSTVHPGTLKAWIREKFISGEDIDFKALNAKVGSCIDITFEDQETVKALKRLQKKNDEEEDSVRVE